jgi:predicted dienelactone hydrolase
VDKQSYSSYASTLARYGFVVVVPNHQRSATNPATGETLTGLLAEQSQVNQVLDFANRLDSDVDSPLYGRIDTERMAVVGHSFGGFAGLGAIQNICVPGVCSEEFERPEELMAGVVYGTSFQTPPDSGEFPPIANENIPVALIAGTADGVAQPTEVTSTYAQVQSPPKLFAAIAGANHYGITNENSDRDPSLPTVDQAVANNAIARWSGLFLRAHLLDDAAAYDYVYTTGDALDGQVATTSRPRPLNLSR